MTFGYPARGGHEPPHERWLWVRWSYVWNAQPGQYRIMSRATDELGRVELQTPRLNNMRKNFCAIVNDSR